MKTGAAHPWPLRMLPVPGRCLSRQNRTLTYAEMLGALQDTGVPVTDTRTGAGSRVKPRIDVQDALDSLLVPGVWIAWDDGVQMDAIGLTEGGTFTAASLWQPADIPGSGTITKVRVGVYDLPVSAAVEIWQGSDAASMELHYSQAFTPAAGQINEIVLDTPYVIDETKDLLIGWSATHSAGTTPLRWTLPRAHISRKTGFCLMTSGRHPF